MDKRLTKRVVGIKRYEPGKAAMKVHTLEAAEKIAKRVGDTKALGEAVRGKLEAQREFAECYRAKFASVRVRGGPGRGKTSAGSGAGFSESDEFCSRFGFAQRTVQRWCGLVDEARFSRELSVRLERVWRAVEMGGGAHVGNASGVNEWYTPPDIIAAAHAVLGGIDLDPASHAEANRTVEATNYFTSEDDGLKQEWAGRVWMNPPYAQPLIEQFCDKLMESFLVGKVTDAISLTNNATDTAWGQRLLGNCFAACFTRGRLRFWAPEREAAAPLQGQMLCYFGSSADEFLTHFSVFGVTRRLK